MRARSLASGVGIAISLSHNTQLSLSLFPLGQTTQSINLKQQTQQGALYYASLPEPALSQHDTDVRAAAAAAAANACAALH